MRQEPKSCLLCAAMQDRVEEATWEYVQADAWAGADVETSLDDLQQLQAELEKAEAEYKEAQADFERHYQKHHVS